MESNNGGLCQVWIDIVDAKFSPPAVPLRPTGGRVAGREIY